MPPFQMIGPVDPALGSAAAQRILLALPDWFGIPEAVEQYIRDAADLPTWVAADARGPFGFLTVRQHNPYAAEIHVMGVLPGRQRMGVGRALVERVEGYLRAAGVEYLQVKTISATHPDPFYARTRAFYLALGFRPLEELPQLWGAENPCLLFVKKIGA